ncbi:MAG TPA: tryptophan-rich sensory protein [Paraburkholderia sp.]
MVRGAAKARVQPAELGVPPAWAVLYVLRAISAQRVWTCEGLSVAIVLWVVQLLFGAA